jgi:hypothetical protein
MLQRQSHRFGQPILNPRPNDHAIDHRVDVVPLLGLQLRRVLQLIGESIDPHADEALFADLLHHLGVATFAAANHRRQNHHL